MAQTYNDIPSTTTLKDSRQPLLDRDDAMRSSFSGATQPSSPVVGQFWFDTGNAKLYQCTVGGASPTWREIPFGNPVAIAQGGTGATTAAAARTALGLGTLAVLDANAITADLVQTSTGSFKVASGSDAQRPGTPSNGMLRYSTTQNTFEGYINGQWQPVGSTTYNNKLVQRFNGTGTGSNQTLTLSSNPGSLNNVDVFIGGIYQQKDQLALSGLSLTVPGAPVGTNNIEVVYGVPLSIGVPADGSVTDAKIAAGSTIVLANSVQTLTNKNLGACTVDGTDQVGYRNLPVNSQSAAYTAVLSDNGKVILHPSTDANARTFTIPSNASVAFPIGTVLSFVNMTSQVVTISINTDTLYLASTGATGNRTLAQFGMASALKINATQWIISGLGLT